MVLCHPVCVCSVYCSVCCNVERYVAVRLAVLQCVLQCCSVAVCAAMLKGMLQCVLQCCSVCCRVCCSVCCSVYVVGSWGSKKSIWRITNFKRKKKKERHTQTEGIMSGISFETHEPLFSVSLGVTEIDTKRARQHRERESIMSCGCLALFVSISVPPRERKKRGSWLSKEMHSDNYEFQKSVTQLIITFLGRNCKQKRPSHLNSGIHTTYPRDEWRERERERERERKKETERARAHERERKRERTQERKSECARQ